MEDDYSFEEDDYSFEQMEDDYSFEQIVVEDVSVRNLKLYKCVKEDESRVNGEVLFVFRVTNVDELGEPGSLSDKIVAHPSVCTRLSIDSSCLVNLDGDEFYVGMDRLMAEADFCRYRVNDQELARSLVSMIRSRFRFGLGVLSRSSRFGLVFVVEVQIIEASKGFVEAKTRSMLVVDDENGDESIGGIVDLATNDEGCDEKGDEESSSSYVDNGDEDDMADDEDDMADEKGVSEESSSYVDNGDDDMADEKDIGDDMADEMDRDEDEEDEDEVEEDDSKYYSEEEIMDGETLDKVEEWKDLIDAVRIWQELADDDVDVVVEEIKPLFTYERLSFSKIGNDYVIAKEEEKRGDCAICLSSYPGKARHKAVFTWWLDPNAVELVRLCCGHAFHHHCIFEWLKKNPTCPLCRSVNYVKV